VEFTPGALKRGYSREDVEHAIENHIDKFDHQGLLELTILIGPTANGELIEVGVELDTDGLTILRVAHVMPSRPKYTRTKKPTKR
jgi:hypothetical protein